jgi:hypothetical protein
MKINPELKAILNQLKKDEIKLHRLKVAQLSQTILKCPNDRLQQKLLKLSLLRLESLLMA